MQDLLVECTVDCPACWERHTVIIDITAQERTIIEDCHVCCNPMQLSFQIDAGNVPCNVVVERA